MTMKWNVITPLLASSLLALSVAVVEAKDKVKVGFIGSLTGGISANGLGGRNSADLAVRLRNADPKAKYEYELVALDDECKPNVGVQVATKLAADKEIIAAATHYCSVGRHRHGRRLSQVRPAGDRVGRGAARHHLSQQVSRGAPRQRHHDQPERAPTPSWCRSSATRPSPSSTTPPTTARATTSISARRSPSTAARSSAPSASPPTSRTSPPSSPRSRRSIRR